jgi:hypothetical protein
MCLIALAVDVVQCLTSNALQRIWEHSIWKLVPEAGYPGAREIPVSIMLSLDDQCIGVRSPEVPGIAICCMPSVAVHAYPPASHTIPILFHQYVVPGLRMHGVVLRPPHTPL